ncbi:receptor-like serine/threonine-protein kinase ALE2 isoform X7 [Arachis ipaensis]|uniref:receptor-like serine/threonine-protein kinase ALE2 isoform X7 n=1 Tax=Arachis ipaensis TaxID=130454 RepID=UPI0007AFA269|nr:receptor-like serine/threonine-protein kinase ALE2 isoform X7 [Arachis ipaensis]XP_025644350.1 receptor-like serine/threonine-protein kinase ALE2 isoform X7 [Arachis hypogaea]
MGVGVVLSLTLQLVKLFIIGSVVTLQGSKGSVISPSPAFAPVIHPRGETLGPIHHGHWRSNAPSSPVDPDGFLLSPNPASLPMNPSPRTISPSSPEVSNGSFLPTPVSSPIPPHKIKGIEPSISPSSSPTTITLSPSNKAAPISATGQGNAPPLQSIQPSPPQRKAPPIRPPESSPISRAQPPKSFGKFPNNSPASQPIEPGSFPPVVENRNASKSHTPNPISPAPTAVPSTNLPTSSPVSQPVENGSFPPNIHTEGAKKGHSLKPVAPAPLAVILPKLSPSQPPEHGSLPPTTQKSNSSDSHKQDPVSQAPVALSPATLPENSPNVHNRTVNKGLAHTPTAEPASPNFLASPPWKMENNQSVGGLVFPEITPSISPAQVAPPPFHPVSPPTVSPSKLPVPDVSPAVPVVVSPALTPSRSFDWKRRGEPVSAPLYKAPMPLPAVVHPPVQAHAVHNSRQFHHAPAPPASPPKSASEKEYHSPASSPLTTSYKHHSRSIATSPAPTSSYSVSPPTSEHQDHQIPPPLPTTERTHHASPPANTGSTLSSPASQVSPAPSPWFIISPHPTKILFHPPKVSPSRSPAESPKKPVLPQIHTLPPPPPNEDCLSTICSEPYTNSPPGAPCRCVLPMKVGLRLDVSLYTFFPLVSELASEIAAGVFMTQSQVRIMGAEAASQDPDKTDALIFLVPIGEGFDHTTALLNSERFWQKKVAIKSSYFGSYEVLYVSYPGLPPPPPLPPSSISSIYGGPYSNNGNNGRMIKPLGVDIQQRHHKDGLSRGIIAIIALSVFLALVLSLAAGWALFKYRHHVSQPTSTPRVSPRSVTKTQGTTESLAAGGIASASSSFRSSIAAYKGSAKTFSASDIEKASNNFNDSRILGEGGFGRVYSGIFEDGTKAAIKVLKREDHHGDREFLAEVEMLSRLHHRNLVKLIGICTEVSFRCLVYELIPNGSVESHLHGVDRENSPLDWSARIKIALGAARGLAYLHEDSSPPVIHRDFKSSNILLEDDFTPKVSDFGLARTAADEENRHISTRVMGTFGYVAPEYAMTGHLLVKSDVYSYGVVLLELLTGRKPVDMSQAPGQENLVAWARPLLTSKEGLEAIIDPSLGTDVPWDSVAKVAAIASMCVQPEVSDRPFMGEVVQALKLVSNECDEAKEAGTRNSSQEDLSLDLDNVSSQLPDHFQFQRQFSAANYTSGSDIEKGLSSFEIFSSSARFGRQDSGSFRRHSYSAPLRTGRKQQLWQVISRLSGSVSEHRTISKL